MRTHRLISTTIAVAAVVAGLAGCSSSGSKAAGQPVTPVSTPVTAPVNTPVTAPAAPTGGSAGGGQTIAAVLTAFGSAGPITTDHMPTADPAWLARVQTESTPIPVSIDPKVRNLMALVDEAAREQDTTSLARLCGGDCDPAKQAALWAKPGVLHTLTQLIEQGPLGDATLLPAFASFADSTTFDGGGEPAIAFGKLVGADSPKAYFAAGGIATSFQNGSGGVGLKQEWMGVRTIQVG